MTADNQTTDPRIDRLARVIGAAIWRPSPDMSGDIWNKLGSLRKRHCEDAAAAVLEELATASPGPGLGLV